PPGTGSLKSRFCGCLYSWFCFLLPRCGASQELDVCAHNPFERTGEPLARTSPSPDTFQAQSGRASQSCRVKVLMCDGIPPCVQILQQALALRIPRIVVFD